jgi:uncharacterized protein YciI
MEPKMSRSWIAGIAVASCASLLAFAPFARQDGKAGAAPQAMTLAPTAWVITFELSKWDLTKSPEQQNGFPEHMANVHKLAADGTLLVGGPLLNEKDTSKPAGAMMIVKAENADAARKLVSGDTIITKDLMKIASVRPFMAGAGAWLPAMAGAPGAGSKK